jgi:hypothetical protein
LEDNPQRHTQPVHTCNKPSGLSLTHVLLSAFIPWQIYIKIYALGVWITHTKQK